MQDKQQIRNTNISAQVVADSICNGHRITTMLVTMPRIILPEFNTHRMLSKNSASSRAIPFKKMVQSVIDNPFIPIAWQRDHKGMQGVEYLNERDVYSINDFIPVLQDTFNEFYGNTEASFDIYQSLVKRFSGQNKTLAGWWLEARDAVIDVAILMNLFGVTKQLCNRLLEPWMYHTVLVTATEWENFYYLRCPQYVIYDGDSHGKKKTIYRSRKDYLKSLERFPGIYERVSERTELGWLQQNEGQAEIHMMALAEAMWDARNESIPKELKPGEWHMPYDPTDFKIADHLYGKMTSDLAINTKMLQDAQVQIATARCAQTSYTVVGEDGKSSSYERLIGLHNKLLASEHMSPFEHCAQAMTDEEFCGFLKGTTPTFVEADGTIGIRERYVKGRLSMPKTADHPFGWCHNLRGWKSYRSMIPNENRR